jgi:hypothetical protein
VGLLVLGLTGVLALIALFGRPPAALGALVTAWTLLPGGVVLLGPLHALPNCARLVEAAALVGVIRYRTRERDRGSHPVPAALVLLLAFVGAAALTGVALHDPRLDASTTIGNWWLIGEQVVVLVLCLELARRTAALTSALLVAAAMATSGAIGIFERLSGSSYARALYGSSPSQLQEVAAQVLERRNGELRVRGSYEFALAYGWVLAAALPVVVVAAVMAARRWGSRAGWVVGAAVPLSAAGIYLSRSRSPLLAALLIGALLLFAFRPQNVLLRAVGVSGMAVGLLVLGPEIVRRVSPHAAQGSVDARFDRLPAALDLAAQHPYRGAGLGAVSELGPRTLDSSYLTLYVETGIVAVTLLVLALAAAVIGSGRVVRVPAAPGLEEDRLLALGAALTLGALLLGSFAFDTFNLPSSSRWTWLLAAIGLTAAVRVAGPPRPPRLSVLSVLVRLVLVAAAVGGGLWLRSLAPSHATGGLLLATLDPRIEYTTQHYQLAYMLRGSACELAQAADRADSDWRLDRCEVIEPVGWLRLVVTADDPAVVIEARQQLQDAVDTLPAFSQPALSLPARFDLDEPRTGIPNLLRTAPTLLGVVALVGVLFVPGPRRRRRAEPAVQP